MSQTMKDVKAITIPEGSVKKIEDSNGNMIWGSYDAYPYRLLEYIDIPADAYINLNDTPGSGLGYYLDVNLNLNDDTFTATGYPFGSIYINGSSYNRYHLGVSTTDLKAWSAGSTSTNLCAIGDVDERHVIELNFHTYGDKKAYLDDVNKGNFTPNSNTSFNSCYLGARHQLTAPSTEGVSNYAHDMRVYFLQSRISASGLSKFYPAQRRSDGKVGLLKIYNDGASVRFCTSETSTELIAGTVVNEYFTGTSWPA